MHFDQGIPTIETYQNLLQSSFFKSMERFSDQFLKENKSALKPYSQKWVQDPLHQWSRQYEYPFVYHHVTDYLKSRPDTVVKILDAGSGVTFFPYYLSWTHPHTKVYCCDVDVTHGKIFSSINRKNPLPNYFCPADIRQLPFDKATLDIVYCISVLEHTDEFEMIIKEFKRILKPNGLFLVTFDISIDGSDDIPKEKALTLIESIEKYFCCSSEFNSKQGLENLESEKLLTTRYIRAFDKNLLPWKYSRSKAFKDLLKLRMPKPFFSNLTCFCQAFINRSSPPPDKGYPDGSFETVENGFRG